MFYAIVDSESLENPTILNKFKQIKVTVQYEPLSNANKYHTVFLIKFEDNFIDNSIIAIQKELKKGWYLFFWNKNTINIVFNTKQFKVKTPINTNSSEYKSAQEFGKSQDIHDEYLNYIKYFQPYYDMTENLK
jgi:hypothetical protein